MTTGGKRKSECKCCSQRITRYGLSPSWLLANGPLRYRRQYLRNATTLLRCGSRIAMIKTMFVAFSRTIRTLLPIFFLTWPPGECIVVGDAVLLPAVVQMHLPAPQPQSQSVKFHKEWQCLWRDITFEDVIARWRKE